MSKLIGPKPDQVPTNAMLGTAAYLDADRLPSAIELHGYDFRRIINPKGAEYVSESSLITGAIAINLPVKCNSVMVRFTVKVYDYATGESFDINIGGYVNGSGSGSWTNVTAFILGNPTTDRRFTVRFSITPNSMPIVYIGETTSTWAYPQVFVTDIQLGYSGKKSVYTDNWSIEFVTTIVTPQQTVTNPQIGFCASANTVNSLVLRDASGNFSAGTITAALSGNSTTTTRVSCPDTRATNPAPSAYSAGIVSDFKQNATDGLTDGGTYHGVMTFRPYSTGTDMTGGQMHQLGFTDSSNIWLRSSTSATNWSTWDKIVKLSHINRIHSCTGVGYNSLLLNSTGANNSAFGYAAMEANTGGFNNTAIGYGALMFNPTGDGNTAIGSTALMSATGTSNNTAIGRGSLENVTTGQNNFGIGKFAGADPLTSITTESNKGVIGNYYTDTIYSKVALTVLSDIRDKTEIQPLKLGLDFVKKSSPVSYKYRLDRSTDISHGHTHLGFIAQELLAIQGDTPVVNTDDPERLKLTLTNLIAVSFKAIQELADIVENTNTNIQDNINTFYTSNSKGAVTVSKSTVIEPNEIAIFKVFNPLISVRTVFCMSVSGLNEKKLFDYDIRHSCNNGYVSIAIKNVTNKPLSEIFDINYSLMN